VQQSEETASHHVARFSSAKLAGVTEGEPLPHGQVDEEPGNPCPIGICGNDGAQ